jgi:hypothetical protein
VDGTGGAVVFHIGYQPAGTAEQGSETAHRCGRRIPQPEALLRLAGAVLVEAHDEWQTTDRRYLAEATMPCSTRPRPHHRKQ